MAEKNRDAAPGVPREDLLIYLSAVVSIDDEPLDPGLPEMVHGVRNNRTTPYAPSVLSCIADKPSKYCRYIADKP